MTKLEISPFEGRSAEAFSISQARTSIGRNPTNDVVVNSNVISGAHAEILRDGDGELTIKDLGSSNGTFVNDEKITESAIKAGDTLRFGSIDGHLTESDEVEPSFFDSLAISQAKQSMKKLQEGLPSASGQSLEMEECVASSKPAAGETSSEEASAPADEPRNPSKEPTKETPTAVSAENDTLKSRISELEKSESELALANEALADKLAGKAGTISELSGQLKEKEAALADQEKEMAALRAKGNTLQQAQGELAAAQDQLSSIQQEIESCEPERVRQQEQLKDFLAQSEAARAAALEENAELAGSLESSRKQLETLNQAIRDVQQEENALAEQVTEKTRELGEKTRAKADVLTRIKEGKAQLAAVQQEIESFEPQRLRQQQELNEFLAQAEAAKAAALEENAGVARALEASRKQLESLDAAIGDAQREEHARIEEVMARTRELEEQGQAEEDALARTEERKAVAEEQLNDIALATQAMEIKCAGFEAQVGKAEKALKRIHFKIGWRKKLLARLKTVARREREVAKQIEEARELIEKAESLKAGGYTLAHVQPWDVDRARAERDEALEEARKVQEEVELMKAELKGRRDEPERGEARIGQKQKQKPEPVHS